MIQHKPTVFLVRFTSALLRVLLILSPYLTPLIVSAQGVLIGPNDMPPHNSALLHLDNTGYPAQAKKGLLPPQVELTRLDQPGPVGPLPIPPSLIVFNTATTALTGNDAQYNVYPGLYAWDGTRWLRFEGGLGRQVYVVCNPYVLTLNSSTTPTATVLIPTASAFQHLLQLGDRVILEASGVLEMTPVGATNDATRWTTVEVEIVRTSPLPLTTLARTFISLDTRFASGSAQSAFFGFFSSSSSGFQQRSAVQDWSLVTMFQPTSAAAHTFTIRARKLTAVGVVTSSVIGTTCLRAEVFKH